MFETGVDEMSWDDTVSDFIPEFMFVVFYCALACLQVLHMHVCMFCK